MITSNLLFIEGKPYSCTIGKGGLISAEEKKEGDMCTPMGVWPLRGLWHRADHIHRPTTHLPRHSIHKNDGWCDDPKHKMYNQHVKLPFTASHEDLHRVDRAYDLIIPLGYNDDPIVPGKGSAIFIHCAHDDGRATAGCIALDKKDFLEILPFLSSESRISISPEKMVLLP